MAEAVNVEDHSRAKNLTNWPWTPGSPTPPSTKQAGRGRREASARKAKEDEINAPNIA